MKKIITLLFILSFLFALPIISSADEPKNEGDSVVEYVGVASRITKYPGLRSLWQMDKAAVAALEAEGYDVYVGSLMGVQKISGVTRRPHDLSVVYKDGKVSLASGITNAASVTVYAPDGAGTQLYTKENDSAAEFAFTTTFSSGTMNKDYYELSLIYAAFTVLVDESGNATYYYDYPSGTALDYALDTYEENGVAYYAGIDLYTVSEYFVNRYDKSDAQRFFENEILREVLFACGDISDLSSIDGFAKAATDKVVATVGARQIEVVNFAAGVQNTYSFRYTADVAGYYDIALAYALVDGGDAPLMKARSQFSDSMVLSTLLPTNAPVAVKVANGYAVPTGTDFIEGATVTVYLEEGENVVNLWQESGSAVVLSKFSLSLRKEFAPLENDSVLGLLDLRQRPDGTIETFKGDTPNAYFPTGTTLTGTNLGVKLSNSQNRDRVLTLPAGAYIDYSVAIAGDRFSLISLLANHTSGAFKLYDVTNVTEIDYASPWNYTENSDAVLVFSSGDVKNVDAVGEVDYYDFGKVSFENAGKRVYRLYAESEISLSELRITDMDLKVLTISYKDANGNTVAPTREYILNKGEDFNVVSPYVEGMSADNEVVVGTLLSDTHITVTYTEAEASTEEKQSITYTAEELSKMAVNRKETAFRYDKENKVLYVKSIGSSSEYSGFRNNPDLSAYLQVNVTVDKEGVYGIYLAQQAKYNNGTNMYIKYNVHNCTLSGACTEGTCVAASSPNVSASAAQYGKYLPHTYYPQNMLTYDTSLTFDNANYDMSGVTMGDTPILYVYLAAGKNSLRIASHNRHVIVVAGITEMKIELVNETEASTTHIMAQDSPTVTGDVHTKDQAETHVIRAKKNTTISYAFSVKETGCYDLYSLMGGGGYANYESQRFTVKIRIGKNNGTETVYDDSYTSPKMTAGGGDEGVAEHKAASGIYLEKGTTYRVEVTPTDLFGGDAGGFKLMDIRFMKDESVPTRELTVVGGLSEELSETVTAVATLTVPDSLRINGYNAYIENRNGVRISSLYEVENGETVYVRYESVSDFDIKATMANMTTSKGVSFLANDPSLLHVPAHTKALSETMINNSYYVAFNVKTEYSGIYALSLLASADGEYDFYAGVYGNTNTFVAHTADYDTSLSAAERWAGATGTANYMYLPAGESTVWLGFRGTTSTPATFVDIHSVRFTLFEGRNDGTDGIFRENVNKQFSSANATYDITVSVPEAGNYDLWALLGSQGSQTVTVSTVNGETVTVVGSVGPQEFGTTYRSAYPYKIPAVSLPEGTTTLRITVETKNTTTFGGFYVVPTVAEQEPEPEPEPEPITTFTYTAAELYGMRYEKDGTEAFRYDKDNKVLYVKSVGSSGVKSGFSDTALNAYFQLNVTVDKEGVYAISIPQMVKYNSTVGGTQDFRRYIKYTVHNCTLSVGCTKDKCVAASSSSPDVSASAAQYGNYLPHTYYPQDKMQNDTSLTLANANYNMSDMYTAVLYVYLKEGENSLRITSHNRHTLVVAGITEMKIELLTETTEDTVQVMAQDASKTFTVKTTSGSWAESTKQAESGVVRMAKDNTLSYTFSVNKTGYYDLYSLMGGGGYANYDKQKFSVEIRIGEENGASTAYGNPYTYTSTEKSGGGDEGVAEHKAIEGVYLEQDKTYRIEFKPTELYEGGGFKLMDMRFIYQGETNE